MASATYFSTVVSKQGLDYIWLGYPTGGLIDISYFVPMYDYRIDPTIMEDGVAVSAFSAVAREVAVSELTTPIGEKIWYTNSSNVYNMSSPNYLISAVAGTYQYNAQELLVNPTQTQKPAIGVNLYNGTPLVNSISAATMNYDLANDRWELTNYTVVSGSNALIDSVTSANNLYRTVDYFPVYESTSGNLRGSFTCRISNNNGKFKFNKIAFYAVRRNADGTFFNGDGTPFYFGECYIQEPIIKGNFSNNGLDDIICTTQFSFETTTSAFSNIFYSTSGDYWQRGINGLHYPMKVGVGSFDDVDSEPDAVMHLRQTRTSANNTIDYNIPHLRMDYDVSNWVSFKANQYGGVEISATTMTSAYPSSMDTAIYPYWSGTVGLGEGGRAFGELWLRNDHQFAANINGGEVLIGKVNGYNSTETSAYSLPALVLQDRYVEITSGVNEYGAFVGGDVFKKNTDLLMFNVITSGSPKDITIVAGLDINGSYVSYDAQTGWSHQNLSTQLNYNEEFKPNLVNDCKLHLAAKGGVNIHGMLELEPINDDYGTRMDWFPFEYKTSFVISRNRKIGLFSGIQPMVSYDQLNSVLEESKASIASMLTVENGLCGSTIYLVARTIDTYGDIETFVDGGFSIGTDDYRFNELYINSMDSRLSSAAILNIDTNTTIENRTNFEGFDITSYYMRGSGSTINIQSSIAPPSYSRIVSGRTLINTSYIGLPNNPINNVYSLYGEFDNINISRMTFGSDDLMGLGQLVSLGGGGTDYSVRLINTSAGVERSTSAMTSNIGYIKNNKSGFLVGNITLSFNEADGIDLIYVDFSYLLDNYFNVGGYGYQQFFPVVQSNGGPLQTVLSATYCENTEVVTGFVYHTTNSNLRLCIRRQNGLPFDHVEGTGHPNVFHFKIPVELV